MNKTVKKFIKSKIFLFFVTIMVFILFVDLLFPLPSLKPYSKTIYSNSGTLINAYLSSDDKWRMRTRLDEVTPDLINAIIEKEDSWFYWHLGVNPVSVVRAITQNIFSGKRVSGASTITMQVARLLEPAERTYWNKLSEMFRAFQIELHFSKNEILEIYLSHLPFGGNIEGVKSASFIYFNRSPEKLSLSQSILLTVIPNDPNNLRLDISSTKARIKRDEWINRFIEDEIFPIQDLLDAKDEPVFNARFEIPNTAPHFSRFVSSRYKNDQISSSLNLIIQNKAETLLKKYVERVKGKGVTNGSVIIIDNRNSNVVGYCGSADFYDEAASGQVNGITAVRSPGSTLKPILYAYAFDNGFITPQMKLLDIPTDFGGYEPENYDLKFYGDVSADFALANSLNVPAVRLLRDVGLNNIISLLERSGFETISKLENKLGLSMILGGCGVTLEELTRLFTSFALNGELHGLNYIATNRTQKGVKLFTEESAFLVGRTLTKNERPDFPIELLYTTKQSRIAWKTGTSYGKRDAWAIGFNPNFTIGVWMGNFDGKGSPHLSGAEMAVPLLFNLFNTIDYDSKKDWFDFPENLKVRKVCAETGLIPSKYCTNIIDDYFIENHSPMTQCNLNRELFVNENETIEYCPECLPKAGYKKAAYPFHEPELTLWQKRNNIQVPRPPEHNPKCSARFSSDGPIIISPSKEFEYFIEKGNEEEILLQAASEPNIKLHYWFVNDRFFVKCLPTDKIFLTPEVGKQKITCMDDRGRETTLNVMVRSY